MEVKINKTSSNSFNNRIMRSGDLIYNEDSKEYFQVIQVPDLKGKWLIYNL